MVLHCACVITAKTERYLKNNKKTRGCLKGVGHPFWMQTHTQHKKGMLGNIPYKPEYFYLHPKEAMQVMKKKLF